MVRNALLALALGISASIGVSAQTGTDEPDPPPGDAGSKTLSVKEAVKEL